MPEEKKCICVGTEVNLGCPVHGTSPDSGSTGTTTTVVPEGGN